MRRANMKKKKYKKKNIIFSATRRDNATFIDTYHRAIKIGGHKMKMTLLSVYIAIEPYVRFMISVRVPVRLRAFVCMRPEIRAETYSLRQLIAARAQSNLLRCDFPSVFLVHRVRRANVGSANTCDYRLPRHNSPNLPLQLDLLGVLLATCYVPSGSRGVIFYDRRIELDSIPIPLSFLSRFDGGALTDARHAVLDLQM